MRHKSILNLHFRQVMVAIDAVDYQVLKHLIVFQRQSTNSNSKLPIRTISPSLAITFTKGFINSHTTQLTSKFHNRFITFHVSHDKEFFSFSPESTHDASSSRTDFKWTFFFVQSFIVYFFLFHIIFVIEQEFICLISSSAVASKRFSKP